MATLTTFDQGDGWNDDDIYGSIPDIEAPAHFTGAGPVVNREGLPIGLDAPPYVPYVSAGDAEYEPVEVLDEEALWESYFSRSGRPEDLKEDPFEESGFLIKERLLPGKKMVNISPRKKKWSIIQLSN